MTDEQAKQLQQARDAGKKVGLVQGSWDMLHLGHICYLQEARKTCDFLVVTMDDDEKIRKRKGANRPIIPLEERYQTINRLGIADMIIVKTLNEPHWYWIKTLSPDVLVAIKENYSDEDIIKLQEYCGRVAVLPRQATTSTSDIIRRTLIKNGVKALLKKDPRVSDRVAELKEHIGDYKKLPEPWPKLLDYLENSNDWVTPTAVCCKVDGKWHFGTNKFDQSIPVRDIEERSELLYSTIEHGEINLLKAIDGARLDDTPVYTVLFPCDRCMKTLIDKGMQTLYYLEDHPERNWSKRSHAKAEKAGVRTIRVGINENGQIYEKVDGEEELTRAESDKLYGKFKYIDPRNARSQDQLDVMLENEYAGKDPLALENVDDEQEIVMQKKYWYVTKNRYPYADIEYQFVVFALGEVYDIGEMSAKMWAELQQIWNELREEYQLPGGAMCFRFGDTFRSKASLKRVHCHIIVPKEKKKVSFSIGSTRFGLKEGLKVWKKSEQGKKAKSQK